MDHATVSAQAAAADRRIRPHVQETPLEYSLYFSQDLGTQVYLKLENLQRTGSFKARGAVNKLLTLDAAARRRGVVAASSGNHGAAVAYSAHALGVPALVFVPDHASPAKLAAMRRYGAAVRFAGDDSLVSELAARAYADEQNLAYVSPYNDPDVVAGQGTVGVEIARQLPDLDAVFVAVGGGGLIGGVAAALKAWRPGVQIVGCLPANSPVMLASVRAGHIVDMPALPTLSDGTAGGIEPGAITFELCQQLVDDWILVSEAEIAAAMRQIMENEHLLVEGSAGVAAAGLVKLQDRFRSRKVVVVLCGGNISLETLRSVLASPTQELTNEHR